MRSTLSSSFTTKASGTWSTHDALPSLAHANRATRVRNAFVVEDEGWAIRYIEVSTQNWWPGKKVLISPAWIERVSWTDSRVYIGLSS